MRDLGPPLAAVRAVLDAETDEVTTLGEAHTRLGAERDRLDGQIAAVATSRAVRLTEVATGTAGAIFVRDALRVWAEG